jgi:hypothetical protein
MLIGGLAVNGCYGREDILASVELFVVEVEFACVLAMLTARSTSSAEGSCGLAPRTFWWQHARHPAATAAVKSIAGPDPRRRGKLNVTGSAPSSTRLAGLASRLRPAASEQVVM